MTIREVFELRKQGRIEEAYDAIRARYATYRGKYTTLCMFWTARDIFNLRIQQGRIEEAAKIYKALQRVLPNINDSDGRADAFMDYAHRRLLAAAPAGSPAVPPASSVLSDSVAEGLNPGQQSVLNCIKANPGYNIPRIETATGIPYKSIERHVSALIAKQLIEHRGSKKTGGYYTI